MAGEIHRYGNEVREETFPGVPDGPTARYRLLATCRDNETADRICRLLRVDAAAN